MNRRSLLTAAALAVPTALLAGCSDKATQDRPLALVYRGPASCDGCSESAAALLKSLPNPFRVRYCGTEADAALSARALEDARLYVQPGGGDDVDAAWSHLKDSAALIQDWVGDGGRYLGICMGGYLTDSDPGFGILPGNTNGYIDSPSATVSDSADTVVPVIWRDHPRDMYFQDGPYFSLDETANATVLATYDNGTVAAAVARFGAGRLGVVGPHPEADASWYSDAGLSVPDEPGIDLGQDLIISTMDANLSAAALIRSDPHRQYPNL